MEEERYGMPLFDGSNFDDWKFRMEVYLDEKDLLIYIKKPVEELLVPYVELENDNEATKTNKRLCREKIMRNNKHCKSRIIQKIQDSQLEHVKGANTAYETWKCLEEVFLRKGIASQLLLKKKLLQMKYRPSDETLSVYFLKFDRLIRDLKGTGAKMEEMDIVCHLLLTMPPEYDMVVTALETLSQEKLSVTFVKNRLLEEESKRTANRKGKPEIDSSTAFSTSKNGSYNSNFKRNEPSSGKFQYQCHNCGIKGHKRIDCWKPGGGKHNEKQTKYREKGKSAHIAEEPTNKQETKEEDKYIFMINKTNNRSFIIDEGNQLNSIWVLDSGASDHIVQASLPLTNRRLLDKPIKIRIAKSDTYLYASEIGDINVNYGGKVDIEITNALVVQDLEHNLISISKLESKGFVIIFKNGVCMVNKENETIAVGIKENNLYKLKLQIKMETKVSANVSEVRNNKLWHLRLGHIGYGNLQRLGNIVEEIKLEEDSNKEVCDICMEGKQTRLPYKKERIRAKRPLERIHSDLCGPISPESHDGKKYIMTLIDDYTHFTVIFLLKSKSEVFQHLKIYEAMATARFNTKICTFRCDNGREYLSNEIKTWFEEKGIQMELTIPYTPQNNGVSERMNRTILEKARCMLAGSKLPKTFWSEAVMTAVYLINRSPIDALGKERLPAEEWYGVKQNMEKLRIFGCIVYLHQAKELTKGKLDSRSKKCIMVGYCSNGYRLWNPEERRILTGRDAIFVENRNTFPTSVWEPQFYKKDENQDENKEVELDSGGVHDIIRTEVQEQENLEKENRIQEKEDHEKESNENQQNIFGNQEIRKSNRPRHPPKYLEDYDSGYIITATALNAIAYIDDVPLNFQDLENREDKESWMEAVNEELASLKSNNTWKLTKLPAEKKTIDSRWVFTMKRNAEGEIERYKARLVVKGCAQRKGLDYNETYAPVARLTTLRTLLCLINYYKLHAYQLDVKNAFLHGELKEEIYMKPPNGIKVESEMVCKLNKTLYGLKQSPMEWNAKFDKFVKGLKFTQCENDKCLYIYRKENTVIYLLLYVDDFIISSNDL